MSWNIVLWLSCIWIPFLIYFIFRNDTRFKKNIVVGVTIPFEGREDSEVLSILKKFKRILLWMSIVLTLCAVPGIFIKDFGIQLTVWLVWIDIVIVLPFIPYVQCNKKLKQLKLLRGWAREKEAVAELKVAAVPIKWLSPWLFVLPFAISLIPIFWDREMWGLYTLDAVMILLSFLSYRYLYRNKSELVDSDIALTEALTRIRRRNWGRCWLLCAWFMAALNILMWLTQNNIWLMMASILIISVVLCAAAIEVEFGTRRVQEKLTKNSGVGFYVDDDDKWLWGMFYYDRNDSRLIVNDRIGINTTVNLAKPAGKILTGILILILLAMPLSGVYLMHVESCPVTLMVEDDVIRVSQAEAHYEIDINDVSEIELLEEKPEIARVSGTDLESVARGKYRSEYGNLTVCIDPRVSPYILIELNDGSKYLVGSSDNEEALYVYEILLPIIRC